MSSLTDLIGATKPEEGHDLYRQMVQLEIDSSFAFQGARWLGDIAPHLLSGKMRGLLAEAKHRAILRKRIEGQLTKAMLYVKGWPTRMLTDDEAEVLASVRFKINGIYGFPDTFSTVDGIHERYAGLLDEKSRKVAA